MTTDILFEDDMYYSLNDIAQKTDLPKDIIRQELEEQKVNYRLMLGKIRVYEGKYIEPLMRPMQNKKSKHIQPTHTQYPFLKNDKNYSQSGIMKTLGLSKKMFETIYLGINRLRYAHIVDGVKYYKGHDINCITHHINQGFLPIKPIRLESGHYTKVEVLSKLSIKNYNFNKIYIQTYGLKPTSIENRKSYQGYIIYHSDDINPITQDILNYYGRVLP